jgi:hypothetical protein
MRRPWRAHDARLVRFFTFCARSPCSRELPCSCKISRRCSTWIFFRHRRNTCTVRRHIWRRMVDASGRLPDGALKTIVPRSGMLRLRLTVETPPQGPEITRLSSRQPRVGTQRAMVNSLKWRGNSGCATDVAFVRHMCRFSAPWRSISAPHVPSPGGRRACRTIHCVHAL